MTTSNITQISNNDFNNEISSDTSAASDSNSTSNDMWEQLLQEDLKLTGGKSTPPDSGSSFITDPGKYESGYSKSKSKNVASYNQDYFLMSYVHSGGVCGATATLNMIYYYYMRDKTKYKGLHPGSWRGLADTVYWEQIHICQRYQIIWILMLHGMGLIYIVHIHLQLMRVPM